MGSRKTKKKRMLKSRIVRLTKYITGLNVMRWDATYFRQHAGNRNNTNKDKQNYVVFDANDIINFYALNQNAGLLARAARKCDLLIKTNDNTPAFSVNIIGKNNNQETRISYMNAWDFIRRYFRSKTEVATGGQIWVLILDIKGKNKKVAIPIFNDTAKILCTSNTQMSNWHTLSYLLMLCLGLVFSGFALRYSRYTEPVRIARVAELLKQREQVKQQEKIVHQQVLQEVGFGFF